MSTTSIKPGVYEMTEAKYRPLSALNWSTFKHCLSSPMEARDRIVNPRTDPKKTNMGAAQHSLVLTPDLFRAEYAIAPAGLSLATKAGKEFKANALKAGKRVLNAKDGDKMLRVMVGVRKCQVANWLISQSKKESVIIWDEDGTLCKAKLDGFLERNGGVLLWDLKGTGDPKPEGWVRREAVKLNYAAQMAWYANGLAKAAEQSGADPLVTDEVLWLVHSDKSGECCPVRCPDSALEDGHRKWRKAFDLWVDAKTNNNWAGRWDSTAPVDCEWPDWALEVGDE
jgi:hypothetical protein